MKKSFIYSTKAMYRTLVSIDYSYKNLGVWLINKLKFIPGKVLIITDNNVAKYWLQQIIDPLKDSKFRTITYTINRNLNDDESVKSFRSANKIYRILLTNNFNRSDIVISLGGGVIGDLAGFCASTFYRGVPLIHCPTTLLAQVDSSIGGKTALHLKKITNAIGTYYQPRGVFINLRSLDTLPGREFWSGFSEIVKIALILDKNLAKLLDKNANKIKGFNKNILKEIILKSSFLKASVISRDVNEKDFRLLLNFGHTIGQAIETTQGHKVLRHGEAVAIGMTAAAKIGQILKITKPFYIRFQEKILKEFNLPTSLKESNTTNKYSKKYLTSKIKSAILFDKKRRNNLRITLPITIGKGAVVEIEELSILDRVLIDLF